MFCICNFPDSGDMCKFILYDSKDFNPEDLNLIKIEEFTKDQLRETYDEIPIVEMNDLILRTIRPNARTTTHVLSEANVETLGDLKYQKDLISQKKSKLSRRERELVLNRYSEIMNL